MAKEMPHVLDRNGREIKLGDHVRVIADECNKFLHDYLEEDWTPDMHITHDEFGTVEVQHGYTQVSDKKGFMLWDLGTCWEGVPEKCLEVVDG